MCLLYCIIYLATISVVIYVVGRIYPRKLIFENAFPFKSFSFEKNGLIYEKIKIKKWKTKLPDASLFFNKLFPRYVMKKRIKKRSSIPALIKETCIAESTHLIACILGFGCVKIWKKRGGFIISLLYCVFNIPFILIQRYNRPRLKRTLSRMG